MKAQFNETGDHTNRKNPYNMINEGHHYSKVDQYMYEHGYRKISEIVKFYGVFDKILNISYIIQNYLRFPAQVFHFFPFICKNWNNADEKCV